MRRWIFESEPSGRIYVDLVAFCSGAAATMLLVVRDWHPPEQFEPVLSKLRGFLTSALRSSTWPGTELYGSSATVYRFEVADGCSRSKSYRSPRSSIRERPGLRHFCAAHRHLLAVRRHFLAARLHICAGQPHSWAVQWHKSAVQPRFCAARLLRGRPYCTMRDLTDT